MAGVENGNNPRGWTQQEETALATAFINVSEDEAARNHRVFWERMQESFQDYLGVIQYRNTDQLCFKWRNMFVKINNFNQIYAALSANREPDTADAVIVEQALQEYRVKYDTDFTHLDAWNVVKNLPKFR